MGLGSPGVEMLGTFLVMVMVVLLVVVALEGWRWWLLELALP